MPALLLAALLAAQTRASPPPRCQRGEPCWPSEADVAALRSALAPGAPRSLVYQGPPNPFPCAVPIDSPNEQPLYGAGEALAELYEETALDRAGRCFVNDFYPEYCLISVRNNPIDGWTPAFVAWPLTAEHVQTVVRFATDHNLAICVAGTGHDFMNRHSCDQGVLIRTALLKGAAWVGNSTEPELRLGAGTTWSEAHQAAAQGGRAVSSGWSITVGIAGWSLGGGHGPWAPGSGLGVDNIVAAELVTADGSLVTATAQGTRSVSLAGVVSESTSTDLLWALRGGGGSTWGVLTALTVRTHAIPAGGFTSASAVWSGNMCDGLGDMHGVVDAFLAWVQGVDAKFGLLFFLTPSATPSLPCGARWSASVFLMYQGPTDEAFNATWNALLDGMPVQGAAETTNFASSWEFVQSLDAEDIIPLPWLGSSGAYVGGVSSVLVDRSRIASGELAAFVKQRVAKCLEDESTCFRQELYVAITGNVGSARPDTVSVNPGMRSALVHLVSGVAPADVGALYALGQYSYFSESAFEMDDWKTRLWAADDYARLLAIKQLYDPTHVFWCRHCIGDEETPVGEALSA